MKKDEKWIWEIYNQIIEDDDKILFNEATGCFLSGHYRASYIISWISLIESLKRKINAFSNLGDNRATSAIQKIEDSETQKQSSDKLIFEEAKNCGIIDNSEFSKINFLWEQRCLFAHPYNMSPDIDEVKHIICQTFKISLGKELYYNKTYLNELLVNITNKPFFLPNDIENIRSYANRIIARTPEALHPFLFKTLLSKIGEVIKLEGKFYEQRKLRYFLVELMLNTSLSLESIKWSLENRLTNYPYECFIGFVHQDVWAKLPNRIKEMLIAYFEIETDEQKLLVLKSITVSLIKAEVLEDEFTNRYFIKLNKLSFDSAIHFYGNKTETFKRIWTDLIEYQFDSQNRVIDYLKSEHGQLFINSIDSDSQFKLGRLLKSCSSNNHWKSQYFISDIKTGTYELSDWLKAGIAYGSFISMEEKFKFDDKKNELALIILNDIAEDIQCFVYDKIENIIDSYNLDDLDKIIFNDINFIEITNKTKSKMVNWTSKNKERFELLIEKINKKFSK